MAAIHWTYIGDRIRQKTRPLSIHFGIFRSALFHFFVTNIYDFLLWMCLLTWLYFFFVILPAKIYLYCLHINLAYANIHYVVEIYLHNFRMVVRHFSISIVFRLPSLHSMRKFHFNLYVLIIRSHKIFFSPSISLSLSAREFLFLFQNMLCLCNFAHHMTPISDLSFILLVVVLSLSSSFPFLLHSIHCLPSHTRAVHFSRWLTFIHVIRIH